MRYLMGSSLDLFGLAACRAPADRLSGGRATFTTGRIRNHGLPALGRRLAPALALVRRSERGDKDSSQELDDDGDDGREGDHPKDDEDADQEVHDRIDHLAERGEAAQ